MRPPDDPAGGAGRAARDRIQHQLNTPLTTIWGRAQLLQRRIERAAGLSDGERAAMLAELAILAVAVRVLTARITALNRPPPDGRADPAPEPVDGA